MYAKTLLASLVVSAMALLPPMARGQFVGGQTLDEGRQLADRSLRDYVAAALREDNAQRFGFKNLADAKSAQPGEPIPVLFIGLRELKAYRAGAGVGAVLSNARALWFPVVVQGEVRSKLEVTEIRGKWVAGEFGRPKAAQQLMRMYAEVPKMLEAAQLPKEGRLALVRVPALGVELFYATGSKGDHFVVASMYGEIPDLQVGKIYSADVLLGRLSRSAQTVREDQVR